ncbi:hypothetical protein B296_00040389 [Ensete ventricosum]|uniref:Uncharacterized protein n=1 Tax=Ensete ventricosum TaxID=4639 RepID=A0A426XIE8_ENSVE|nr:hypothetical protein B296_00040389 [Ensete ventricosum]
MEDFFFGIESYDSELDLVVRLDPRVVRRSTGRRSVACRADPDVGRPYGGRQAHRRACRPEKVAFIRCKEDPFPEKCLDKGRLITSFVLSLYS